jgi:hypothetical protein
MPSDLSNGEIVFISKNGEHSHVGNWRRVQDCHQSIGMQTPTSPLQNHKTQSDRIHGRAEHH